MNYTIEFPRFVHVKAFDVVRLLINVTVFEVQPPFLPFLSFPKDDFFFPKMIISSIPKTVYSYLYIFFQIITVHFSF